MAMLADVSHLKSELAEASKRTLRGMVEGKNRARLLLHSVDIQPKQQSRLLWGSGTDNRVVPDGEKDLISCHELHNDLLKDCV
jgi:hypothetical protein